MPRPDHPTPGSPLSADDVGLLKRGDVLWATVHGVPVAVIEAVGSSVSYRHDEFAPEGCVIVGAGLEWLSFIGRPDADGWIAWSGGTRNGGNRPVHPATRVRVKFRSGREDEGQAAFGRWWHEEGDAENDIIAFRLSLPTDRRAEAEADKKHGPKCWGRTSYSDEVAHCYCGDTSPPAGPDAGLETVAWRSSWSGHGKVTVFALHPTDFEAKQNAEWMSGSCEPLVTRQSAAAALEAASKDRDTWKAVAENNAAAIIQHIDRAARAEAQVADRDKRIAELEGAVAAAGRLISQAHGRIHCLPRNTDTDLARALEEWRRDYIDKP